MFFRMFAAVLGAVPLGQLADKKGRKVVLIMHKLNVVVSNSMWLLICKSCAFLGSTSSTY
jgi:MFS family permease